MPWRESCAMDERMRFIVDQRSNEWTMTELCERFEISRKTGYKWLDRYCREGPAGLVERLAEAIIGLRRDRPTWGARKIIGKLCERQPDAARPSPSTAGEILKRAGLVTGRRLRRRGPPRLGELTTPQRANHVWGVDRAGCGWATARAWSR